MNAIADRVIRLSDGRALAYAEYGSPLGEPVIHCHGAPSSRVEGDLSLHAAAVDRGVGDRSGELLSALIALAAA
jgi:hypothetical protein